MIGAGSVGLFIVASLRRLTEANRIICVAKHERQREEALRLGADEVVHPKETYGELTKALGADVYAPELGKPVVMGGLVFVHGERWRAIPENIGSEPIKAGTEVEILGFRRGAVVVRAVKHHGSEDSS